MPSFKIALICLFAGFGGCASTGTPNPEQGSVAVYEVLGMDCPACHGGLEKNLRKVPGVVDAKANWKEKKVTIRHAEGHSLDSAEVEAAVKSSNFTPGKRLK